jgi:hypothetical protein
MSHCCKGSSKWTLRFMFTWGRELACMFKALDSMPSTTKNLIKFVVYLMYLN